MYDSKYHASAVLHDSKMFHCKDIYFLNYLLHIYIFFFKTITECSSIFSNCFTPSCIMTYCSYILHWFFYEFEWMWQSCIIIILLIFCGSIICRASCPAQKTAHHYCISNFSFIFYPIRSFWLWEVRSHTKLVWD